MGFSQYWPKVVQKKKQISALFQLKWILTNTAFLSSLSPTLSLPTWFFLMLSILFVLKMSLLKNSLLCPLHLPSSRVYYKYTFLNFSFLIFITVYMYLSISLTSISNTSLQTKILFLSGFVFFTIGSSVPSTVPDRKRSSICAVNDRKNWRISPL